MSPTGRTLDHLRRCGFVAEVVERWIPRANLRKDFLGCIDILSCHRSRPGIIGVQATSASSMAARLAKARGKWELAVWLRAGGQFQVWGWSLRGSCWEPRIVEVKAEDLAAVVLMAPRRRRPRKGDQQRGMFEGLGS
jgi:hypothetical protein